MNVETVAGVLLIVAPCGSTRRLRCSGNASITPTSFAGPPRTSCLGSARGDRR